MAAVVIWAQRRSFGERSRGVSTAVVVGPLGPELSARAADALDSIRSSIDSLKDVTSFSATRYAFAMTVSAGLTLPLVGCSEASAT
jgi:hypothetical protein